MLIGGVASLPKFRPFARVFAPPLSNPTYAPACQCPSRRNCIVTRFAGIPLPRAAFPKTNWKSMHSTCDWHYLHVFPHPARPASPAEGVFHDNHVLHALRWSMSITNSFEGKVSLFFDWELYLASVSSTYLKSPNFDRILNPCSACRLSTACTWKCFRC